LMHNLMWPYPGWTTGLLPFDKKVFKYRYFIDCDMMCFFSFILNKLYRLSRARRWLLNGNYWNMKLIQNLEISRTTPKPVVCTSFHFTTTFIQMKNSIPTKLISIRKPIYYNNWFFRNHLVKLNSMAFVFRRSWNSIACLNMCYLGSINIS
jgi:hypothetical protein